MKLLSASVFTQCFEIMALFLLASSIVVFSSLSRQVKTSLIFSWFPSPPHSITCFCGCVCQSPKFKRTDQIFLSRFLNKPERREEDLSLLLYYESMCRYIEHTFIPQGTYCMIRETRVKSIYKYMRHAVRSSYCCRGCT